MQSINNIFHSKQNKTLEKIYIACFNDYKSQLEISKLIRGNWSSNISRIINKYPDFFEIKEKQKSWKNVKYRAKIDPLIEVIKKEINLTDKEEKFLKNSLNKKYFRKMILYEKQYKKIIDILNVLQTYTSVIQICRTTFSKFAPIPKLPLKETFIMLLDTADKNPIKNIITEYDKIVDEEYEKSPVKIQTYNYDINKFKRFIDFEYEIEKYDDELLNKLTQLIKKSKIKDTIDTLALNKFLERYKNQL